LSHLDRLRVGKYTAPSGAVFQFNFDDLGRQGGKKTDVSEIPQSDFAKVQDLGAKATQFRLELYFTGPDYDKTADAFWAALGEHGPGRLQHPRWGDLDVLAESYGQEEKFVDGLGRAVFSIDFIHAPPTPAIAVAIQTAAGVVAAAKASAAAASAAFASGYTSPAGAAAPTASTGFAIPALQDLMECKDRLRKTMREIKRTSLRMAGGLKELSQRINAETVAFINDLDQLIMAPVDLADALGSVIGASALAPVSVGIKLSSYIEEFNAVAFGPTSPAQAAINVLTVQAIASAGIEASATGDLASRSEAIAAHDRIVELYNLTRSAVENSEASASYIADPVAMQSLAQAAAAAKAYLLEVSFSLRSERRIILSGAATPLELVHRFYGDVDRLDEFCDQNHLQGDQLLIVPAGAEVSYYVG
jgi:prophage DNA circulation protein